MQRTPLADVTAQRGAAWRADAGWEVAAQYGDPAAEDLAVHRGAGLRDASHWARLRFSGRDHLEFLHRMATNRYRDLRSGHGLEAVFADNRGSILELA